MIKKILLISILTMLLLSIPVTATEELPPPGILPDNPFYPIKIFIERVRIWFTFNPEAKAKLHLDYSLKRLAELNVTIARGKLQYVERLRRDYEDELRESEAEMNRSLALGINITALAEHVCNMTYKHVLVLERVLEKVPNISKPIIERVINASIERHEFCVEKIIDKINRTIEKVKKINCTSDVDCRNLLCPMILGNDTPLCRDGKCKCGARWELNQTEWKERFKEELRNETLLVIQKIRERIRIHR